MAQYQKKKPADQAAWHIKQTKKAEEKGRQLYHNLEDSYNRDDEEYDKQAEEIEKLQKDISETEASRRARQFVIGIEVKMKQPLKPRAETYRSNNEAKHKEKEASLKSLQSALERKKKERTSYLEGRKKGRKGRLDDLVKEVHKVHYHALQAGNLQSPSDDVLKMVKDASMYLTGPYSQRTKTPMWKRGAYDYNVDPKFYKK